MTENKKLSRCCFSKLAVTYLVVVSPAIGTLCYPPETIQIQLSLERS